MQTTTRPEVFSVEHYVELIRKHTNHHGRSVLYPYALGVIETCSDNGTEGLKQIRNIIKALDIVLWEK